MLYLVATPIGNLGDISSRALKVLGEVDVVASEDTRRTGILLKHFDIKARQMSFHEHNKRQAAGRILRLLEHAESVALVTDGGTPSISDPGYRLVELVVEKNLGITMVPGPAAFVMAVALSGLPTDSFVFRGFAPRKKGKRRRFLQQDKHLCYTLIYYESPHRLRAFLAEALDVFGDRRAAVAKELTKLHESVRRARLSELLETMEAKPKGEYVVVIEGAA